MFLPHAFTFPGLHAQAPFREFLGISQTLRHIVLGFSVLNSCVSPPATVAPDRVSILGPRSVTLRGQGQQGQDPDLTVTCASSAGNPAPRIRFQVIVGEEVHEVGFN